MFNWINFIQLIVIFMILLFFYNTFIRHTAAEKIVRGLFSVLLLWVVSYAMYWIDLKILGGFFRWTALFLSVGLIVVFQPELRKFLSLMGNRKFLHALIFTKSADKQEHDEIHKSVEEIITAVEYMSQKHTGALIVFQNHFDPGALEKVGTKIDAVISAELLMTIFFNKTPLHDGALVIDGNRILSAGAILSLSKNELKWKFGTRHRAAIGHTENSRDVVLVISEETGDISISERGTIKKYENMKALKTKLEKVIRNEK